MKPTMITGAPGTGKTHALVDEILKRRPEKFALVSFTRRAAREARQRLRPYYSDRELRYVRTIHSLCFELLGLRTTQVMTFQHLREFGENYGYMFTYRNGSQTDDRYYGLTEDDLEFRQMMINTAKMIPTNIDMWNQYKKFKMDNHLVDYNDMLARVIYENFGRLKDVFELLLVDEIQDLSPLQMAVVKLLSNNSEQTIYAGDANQMIFEWAGVDRQSFIELQKTCDWRFLNFNWRGNPKKEYCSCVPEMDLRESWLVLSRNNYTLHNLMIEGEEFICAPWQWLSFDDNSKIKVKLSTIHGAKGAEADNVILFTDVSPATYENIDSEAEGRVWYVGCTRARKKLYIVEPQTEYFYDLS